VWRPFVRKPASDADLEEEFQAHLAIEIKQLMESGLGREQAEQEAHRRFGNRTLLMELTREAGGRGRFAGLEQDIRYAARVLRRQPVFTVAAVLSLALGIAAATAVVSIADTVFLRPLPYADAERLVWLAVRFSAMGGSPQFVLSPDYAAWRRENRVFEQLAAAPAGGGSASAMVLGGPNPAEIHVGRVSANFLDTFAVTPALGRGFRSQEELPNAPKAAILTDQFWRDHFHARSDALGATITLDGQPYTVVGVLPKSFIYPIDARIDLLTVLAISPDETRHGRMMSTWTVFGRLKRGVTLPEARTNLEALFAAAKADAPQIYRTDASLVLQTLAQHRAGDVRMLLSVLLAAAGFLLAIACANVANLLLARWSARSRELAVRAAIGAGRGRLARQLFTEIALLMEAGIMAAMMLAAFALRAFVHFAAGELPRLSEVVIDGRVLGIALLVAILTAVVFGCLPLLRTGRADLESLLQQSLRGGARRRGAMRRILVATELALSVVLLSGGMLLLETLWHMQNDALGFQPEHVLTVSIPVRGTNFAGPAREVLASEVLAYLRGIPGTQAAATAQCTPLSTGPVLSTFSRSDRPLPEPYHRGDNIAVCGIGADYFKAAGTRLLAGRSFSDEDFQHPGTLAMVNQAAARAYFAGESPLGKKILGGRISTWKTVVGVVADSKNQGLNHQAMPQAFLNDAISTPVPSDLVFLVRTLARPGAVARALREGMPADRRNLFTKTETLDDTMAQMTASPRFNSVLVSTFAAIALLMAIIGVYGVLAFSVTERSQEIGIRMALGASPGSVLALVMSEGAVLVAIGSVAGVAGALYLTRYLSTLLYGVTANDPRTYAGVVVGLALAAAAASFLPARRAAAVDPMVTLRHE
jgi:predicted permease